MCVCVCVCVYEWEGGKEWINVQLYMNRVVVYSSSYVCVGWDFK